MKKKYPTMFRQGDVLVIYVEQLPANAKKRARENGRVVLAHGEITGHAHAITERKCVHYDAPDAVSAAQALLKSVGLEREITPENSPSFLELEVETPLEHEEHGTINLPAGKAVVLRQREYAPEQIRQVAD